MSTSPSTESGAGLPTAGVERFRQILKDNWGYDQFRPMQLEIITAAAAGKDVLALLPTGGGKSVCFQVPALAREGLCLVISPLIALMKDQVERLRDVGIKALVVHSGMDAHQVDTALENAIYGDYKFLYLSPERLQTRLFRERAANMGVSMIVVDEAHCISQWGYDFRPSYLRIADLRRTFPKVNVLALTATATPAVAEDIMKRLDFGPDGLCLQSGFERPNLAYVVRKAEDKLGQLLHIVNGVGGTGLVYVRERKKTAEISDFLKANGVSADFYHAGLDGRDRTERQDAWKRGDMRVMVATNAFGMGIDKADVRFVVHYDMPESLEAYFQEAGRAGRDGNRSYAVLLYNESDLKRLRQIYRLSFPGLDYIRDIYQKLYAVNQLAYDTGSGVSREFDMHRFCTDFKLLPQAVYYAMDCLQKEGYIALADAFENPTRILFSVSRDRLYQVQLDREDLDAFLKVLLRSYTGLFTEYTAIDESYLARVCRQAPEVISAWLLHLSRREVIHYIPRNSKPLVTFLGPRLESKGVLVNAECYGIRKRGFAARLTAMVQYAQDTQSCRSRFLLAYFGQNESADCGICDLCLRKGKESAFSAKEEEWAREVLDMLRKAPMKVEAVQLVFSEDPDRVRQVLRDLLDRGKIAYESGYLTLSGTKSDKA